MENDKALIVSPKIEKKDKYLPAEVLSKLYVAVDDIQDLFYIMWHCETGVRISDIVGVKRKGRERQLGQEIDRIDWDNNRIMTYDHKKDSWRWVYFPNRVRAKLKMWLKEKQAKGITGRELFPFSEKTCNRILKKWCKKIGFKHADFVSTHWCRHTFIRLSRRVGRDIKAVQQNTGDKVETILAWYAELDEIEMNKELEKSMV